MSLERKGYVGLFTDPLDKERVEELVLLWIDSFGSVEQTTGRGSQVLTVAVRSAEDLKWEQDLQFRVSCGEQFTWIYLTQNHHVIETSGLAGENGSELCKDVLVNMPGCREIIDDRNDRRLDELEAKGLM